MVSLLLLSLFVVSVAVLFGSAGQPYIPFLSICALKPVHDY